MPVVHAFVRLLKEEELDFLEVDAGVLTATSLVSGAFQLECSASALVAAGSIAGGFQLDSDAGVLSAVGSISGGFGSDIPAGALTATGSLSGSPQMSIDAGTLTAKATLFGTVQTTINPPSEDVKDILVAEASLSLTFATNIFVGEIPSTPDFVVGVYDTGGDDPDAHIRYERPTVQVRVRGEKGQYRQAHIKLQQMRNFLNGLNGETWNFAKYISIWGQGDILFLGYDDNHRPEFTANFRIHRTDT